MTPSPTALLPLTTSHPPFGMNAIKKGNTINYYKESEADLWERFRHGGEDAFVTIYRRYVNVLFKYGQRYCANPEQVKDCIQDFFLYLREKRSRLGQTTSIKFYLLRSFRRRLFVYMEKFGKECEIPAFLGVQITDCGIQGFIDDEHKDYTISKMIKCLKDLKEREREVLCYYYFDELSYEEIARIMNYDHVSSARRLVYTALNNMKTILAG